LAVLGFYLDCVVGRVEPFFVDFADVAKSNCYVQELFVFMAFDAHPIEPHGFVAGGEDNLAFFCDPHHPLHDGQYVDIDTLCCKLFELRVVRFLLLALLMVVSRTEQLLFDFVQTRARYFVADQTLFFGLVIELKLEILEALFFYVLLAVFAQFAILWDFEDRLNEAFAVIFSD